jgi:iron complex transport system ATP-binding protein
MIEIDNVTKSYGAATVVDGVTLRLPPGRLTALIGPNGAGKSTLLGMIGRLIPMDAGAIRVDGLDVARCDSGKLALKLAALAQDQRITARLTVRDVAAFGRWPHSHGRPTETCSAAVDRALGETGMAGLADRWLDTLSGGQRQRAFIAMTLAQDAATVLFDEPLNNLDIPHARAVMRIMRRMTAGLGRTVVVVLHDVNAAAAYADHIVAMRDGRVVAEGPPAAVIAPGPLSDIYGVDMPVREIDGRLTTTWWDAPAAAQETTT